jgi:hypothetical protein
MEFGLIEIDINVISYGHSTGEENVMPPSGFEHQFTSKILDT